MLLGKSLVVDLSLGAVGFATGLVFAGVVACLDVSRLDVVLILRIIIVVVGGNGFALGEVHLVLWDDLGAELYLQRRMILGSQLLFGFIGHLRTRLKQNFLLVLK